MSSEGKRASQGGPRRLLSLRLASFLSAGLWVLLAIALSGLLTVREWDYEGVKGTVSFRLSSTTSGRVQLYYDLGKGCSEIDSIGTIIRAGAEPRPYQLALPTGSIKALRLDPVDGAGVLLVSDLQIRGFRDELLLTVPVTQMRPNDQIESVAAKGELFEIRTRPGVNDPSLYFEMRQGEPVILQSHWTDGLIKRPLAWALKSLLLLLLFWLFRLAVRNRAPMKAWAWKHPYRALAVVAVLSSVIANYPVVFLGRSIVSPHNGLALLRNDIPAVPGAFDREMADPHRADNGAMMWQHLPYTILQNRALAEGELPLWNRYNSSGVTLFGQGQSMFGDPFHQVLIWLGGPAWAWDIKFVMARVWFGLGLGLVVWWAFDRLGSALVVALFAPFSAFFNYRFAHPSIFSVGYAPWVLGGWILFIGARTRSRMLAGVALLVASHWVLLASGTVKEAYLSALFLDFAGLCAWCLTKPVWLKRLQSLGILILTGFAILMTTAPFWWTFLNALSKAKTNYEHLIAMQFERKLFLGFFDDLFYRVMNDGNGYAPSGNLMMLLGFAAALGAWWAWRRSGLFLGFLAGAVLVLSFSYEVIPNRWVLALPFFRNIELVGLVCSAAGLSLGWACAGWGFACYEQAREEGRCPSLLVGTCVVLMLIIVPYAAWFSYPLKTYYVVNGIVLSLLLVGVLASLTWGGNSPALRRLARVFWPLFFIAVVYRHALHEVSWVGKGPLYTPMSRANLYARSESVEWVKANAKDPVRSIGLDDNFMPGFTSIYGLEGVNGPDALISRPYRSLAVAEKLGAPDDWYFPFRAATLGAQRRILDLLGVRYIFSNREFIPEDAGASLRFDGELFVFERPGAWPRAFFTDRVANVSNANELAELIEKGDGRPFAARNIHDSWDSKVPADLETRLVVPARDYRLLSNTTRFTIDAPKSGYAVLMETYSEADFLVTVDGKPAPCVRINEFAKGVYLEGAGTHRIWFSYWPEHLTASLFLSLAGLILFGATLWLASRLRTSSESGSRPSSGP